MVLPCASVMVMVVLLNDEFTCAMPEAMFLRSRRRTRVASLPIYEPFQRSQHRRDASGYTSERTASSEQHHSLRLVRCSLAYFFLPAIALAGPLRVRALVWVRWPRTGRPRRCRRTR